PRQLHAQPAELSHPFAIAQPGRICTVRRSPLSPNKTQEFRMSEAPARAYPDLHDHIAALEKAGQLIRVDRPINKDTEMHPLVRWQFRGGLKESERKAFLFTHVVDSKGKRYDIPVIVGGLAANREIYRIGLGWELKKIKETGARATSAPIPAGGVKTAPCHEIIIMGDE